MHDPARDQYDAQVGRLLAELVIGGIIIAGVAVFAAAIFTQ